MINELKSVLTYIESKSGVIEKEIVANLPEIKSAVTAIIKYIWDAETSSTPAAPVVPVVAPTETI